GNIRVYCRIRPLLKEEIRQNGDSDDIHHINVLSESSLELLKGNVGADCSSMSGLRTRGNGAIEFSYDRVFGPKDSQLDVSCIRAFWSFVLGKQPVSIGETKAFAQV
ncbi:P-loop containing nucleoside triphosphate hydrolase, partial [Trinorchestia longiramus]